MIEETIARLLEEKFNEAEWSDCFLVDINSGSGNRLQVYIDSDTSLTTAKCARISRFLEHYIEEEGLLGEKYTLEVSSPGVDRPLQFPRQYKKHIGRRLHVWLFDTTQVVGLLTEADDKSITIEPDPPKGRKKRKEKPEPVQIGYDDIEKGIVKISFK